jgi:hypothetical protein
MSILDSKNGGVLQTLAAKERARFLIIFAVTEKEPRWRCVLKSTPSFELVIVPLDSPEHTTTAQQTKF